MGLAITVHLGDINVKDDKRKYACRIMRTIDPITFEVMIDMGLGITYTCKVKMAGVKYRKYDKNNEKEYSDFLAIKDKIKESMYGKDLQVIFITDYKDKSGKYLVDFESEEGLFSETLVNSGLLEKIGN